MHPVRLSEKAWNFAESRRGDRLLDDYVSMLIENLADLSGEGSLMPEGIRLVEVLEAHRPGYGSSDMHGHTIAKQVLDYLREAYHGKVPRTLFVRKCQERGLGSEEIADAAEAFRQLLE